MGNLRRTFVSGKMNKDTDERLLQDGEYHHAENILILESEGSDSGAIQNSLSNRKLTNLNLGANIFTLGTGTDETNKKLYWAVKSDSGCYFIEYDIENQVAAIVLEDTRTVPNRVLDWNEKFLITAMSKVVTSDPNRDLMIINDDNIEPLCFNLARAKTYGPNGFDKEDIFLIKKPPRFAPRVQPTFIAGSSNDIEERFLTFSYKYKFLDGEYSALSSYTNYMFYPGPFKLDYEVLDNLGMLNAYNAVRVTINTGDKRVTDIQCAVKSTNSNTQYIIETFNKEKEGWGDNEIRSFVFSNNKIYTNYPDKEIYRAFDNVPRKAKAQTIIGNLLVMGNFLEGYDLIDANGQKIKPMFNLSIVSSSLDGSPVPISLSTSGSTQNDVLTINLSGKDLKNGSKINVFTSLRSTGSPQTDYNENYPFILYKDYLDASELAQDEDFIFFVKDLMTNVFLKNYTVSGLDGYVLQSNTTFAIQGFATTSISIKSPQLVFYKAGPPTDTKTIYWEFRLDSNVLFYEIGNVSSVKSNRSIEIGVLYLDPFNRSTTVQTQLNNTIFIDHSLAQSKNKIKISLSNNPPAFADRYKFVIKQRKLAYQTIYATTFYIDGLFRWIKMENDNYDKVAVGDNLIVKSDTSGFIPTLIKLKVLEKTPQPKDFIEGNVDPEGNEIKELQGNYIKVKLPSGVSMDYASGGFIEALGSTSSKGDNFNMYVGPFTEDISGTLTDIKIKQGSRIDILLENVKYGGSGGSVKFEKTFFATADYENFEIWYNTEVGGNTGQFNDSANGVVRGNWTPFSFTPSPSGKLYLRIHNELNGNGQHKSYMSGSVNINAANGLIILETEEKKSVDDEVYYETEQTFEIINGKHQGNLQNQNNVLPAIIDLDFYNCFCMGNGAESYIIKDAFNKDYLNVDLRPSIAAIEQYKAIRRSTDLIFSEAYVESSNINGLNVFNTATGNFKELDKQYGSIQKLHSRDNDILILKERKASKVMFQKDILYNVDGSSNVGSIDKTLGSEITYLGSNGIGKHPESFAENNYQIYYANPEQGEITRLSIDGTTALTNGMKDWFRDLFISQPNAKMLGGYDAYSKQYMFSIGDEPTRLLQLSCGNEIIKDNQQGSFTYEFKLNDLSGDIILNYNITAGNATIVARFNEVDHVVSNVTGLGNISFTRTSLVQNVVTVTITASTASVSYSIGNMCPIGSELKIVSVIVNDTQDVDKNTITRFKWGNSNLYSSDDIFNSTPVSKFFTETGIEGVGKFPLNNSVFTIQAFKDMTTSGEFSLEECNRMGFLITDTVYNQSNINTILSAANFISISSLIEPGYSNTKFGSFLFNRSDTDEILYLIWDYTNRKPKVSNDSFHINQGATKTYNIQSNDANESGNLPVFIVTNPANGIVTVNPDGTITYQHNNTYTAEDNFSYRLSNGNCLSDIAVVSVIVDIPKPIANDDYISVNRGGVVSYPIEVNDINPDSSVDIITLVSGPSKGTVNINPDNTITYTHNGIDVVTDTFTYTITNSVFTSLPATVHISVISLTPPVAVDDSVSILSGATVVINELANDTTVNPFTVSIITPPSFGTAIVNPDKTITYTHNGSSNYSDTVVYQLSNGYDTSNATIYISVGVACSGSITASGSTGIYEALINVGTAIGFTGIKYDAQSVPDRFELFYDNVKVADSKYVGDGLSSGPPVSYSGLLGTKTGFHIFNYNGATFDDSGIIQPDFTVVQSDIADNITEPTDGNGTLLFNKTTATPTTIKVRVTGTSGTAWTFQGVCPLKSEDIKVGDSKMVWGFYNEANKTSLAKSKSMKFFLQTTPQRFYVNIMGDNGFGPYGYNATNRFMNDGITWWEIDSDGNILSSGTI